MTHIQKIKIHNYKRFTKFEVQFDSELSVLIGDNEAGKSSILNAIDLVMSGSRHKIESIGLDSLFNVTCIQQFLSLRERKYEDLPELYIEVYLSDEGKAWLHGKGNSADENHDGICLRCKPSDEFGEQIHELLQETDIGFPFEYYSVSFKTFSGESYSGYKRALRHLLLDSSQINNEYATRDYISSLYDGVAGGVQKSQHKFAYRNSKRAFADNVLKELNDDIEDFDFCIRTDGKSSLSRDLTISESGIDIEDKGKGRQSIIKTEYALKNNADSVSFDVILLEEPENHLSAVSMRKLIKNISEAANQQVIIATHNGFVSARLDLRKTIMVHHDSNTPALLADLDDKTAEFFIKAPDNNVLQYVLARKVILVEGDAEYMLLEAFFEKIVKKSASECGVEIISVGGTSFKRYMNLAINIPVKTAVIRDNDKNHAENCIDNYADYTGHDHMRVFSEVNDDLYTFEVIMYEVNKDICDELFLPDRRTLTVLEYMIGNKSEVAFELLDKKMDELVVPDYIARAVIWINE